MHRKAPKTRHALDQATNNRWLSGFVLGRAVYSINCHLHLLQGHSIIAMPPTSSSYIVGRVPKLPPKYALIVMPLLMSCFMSAIISMVNLVRTLGWSSEVLTLWPSTWLLSWAIAFPTVLGVIPVVKFLTSKFVRLG